MTDVYCPKLDCRWNTDCVDPLKGGYCTRPEIELDYDLCEPGLMDCKYLEWKE